MKQHKSVENQQLFDAVKKGDVHSLERALQRGADPNYISQQNDGSPFPLYEAVKMDDNRVGIACTKVLLDHGANINLRTITTRNTPLHEGKRMHILGCSSYYY